MRPEKCALPLAYLLLVAEEPKSNLRLGGYAHLRWELSQASCKTKRAETGRQTSESRHWIGTWRLWLWGSWCFKDCPGVSHILGEVSQGQQHPQVTKPLADWPCLMALVDVAEKKGDFSCFRVCYEVWLLEGLP